MSSHRGLKRQKKGDPPDLDVRDIKVMTGVDQQLFITQLGTPGTETLLPFPNPFIIPRRFKVNEHAQFMFSGRTKFKMLYDHAMSMNCFSKKRLHVHGPLGVGKSHLLAAVAVAMQRAGRNIIYLPDCVELLLAPTPETYIIQAIHHAFAEHPVLGEKCRSLTSQINSRDSESLVRGIYKFCQFARYNKESILLFVDQTDALDAEFIDGAPGQKEARIRSLLDDMTFYHMKITSSAANSITAGKNRLCAFSEERIAINLGLNQVICPLPIFCTQLRWSFTGGNDQFLEECTRDIAKSHY